MAKVRLFLVAATVLAFVVALLAGGGQQLQAAPQVDAPLPYVIATVPIGCFSGSNGPDSVAVDSVHNLVYVANSCNSVIYVIDGDTSGVVAQISDSRISNPLGIGVNPNTRRVYVASNGRSSVVVIDGSTNNVIAELTHSSISLPDQVEVDVQNNRIWVSNTDYGTGSLTIIDGNSNGIITNVGSGVQYPHMMALDSSRGRMYIGGLFDSGGTMGVVSSNSFGFLGTNNSLGGQGGIAVRPIDGKIFVAQPFSDTGVWRVAIMNVDLSFAYPFPGLQVNGRNLRAATYASGTDRVFVNGYDSNTVDVIDAGAMTLVATLGVGVNPNNGSDYNPATGRVYVANRGSGSVTVIQDGAYQTPTVTPTSTPAVTNTPTPTNTPTVTPTPTIPPCYKDAYEPDENVSQAKVINIVGHSDTQNICLAGDQDWHSFLVPTAPMTLDLRTLNLQNGTDTEMFLYYLDGYTQLAWNDDSGGTLASHIQYTFTKEGIYYFMVRDAYPYAYGTYRLYDVQVTGGPPLANKLQLPVVLSAK